MKFPFATLVLAGSSLVRANAAPPDVSAMLIPIISLAIQKLGPASARFTFAHDSPIAAQIATLPEEPASRDAFDVSALIRAAAQRHRIPEAFVKSIVAAESNFDLEAVSPKGAIGLMQLMPATAQEYGADPTNPEQNIDAGTRYLSHLMARYRKSRDPLACAIAAYNAGPSAVDRHRGVPPFRETRQYVARVLAFLRRFRN